MEKWKWQKKEDDKVGYYIETDDYYIGAVDNRINAHLIVTAVNACIEINPENPLAVAESIGKMLKALEGLLKPYAIPDDASFPSYPEYWVNVINALAKAREK